MQRRGRGTASLPCPMLKVPRYGEGAQVTDPTMSEEELREIVESARNGLADPVSIASLISALRASREALAVERGRAERVEGECKQLRDIEAWGLRMMKERDARPEPQKCLSSLRPHDSPDGPPCTMMGEFKCFDCGAWVCRNHAEFHFENSERSKFKVRAEAAESALAAARERALPEDARDRLVRVLRSLYGMTPPEDGESWEADALAVLAALKGTP